MPLKNCDDGIERLWPCLMFVRLDSEYDVATEARLVCEAVLRPAQQGSGRLHLGAGYASHPRPQIEVGHGLPAEALTI